MSERGALHRIMEEFSPSGVVLGVQEVAMSVGKDPKVVAGMLDALVGMGKLEVADGSRCGLCPLRAACNISDEGARCYRRAR